MGIECNDVFCCFYDLFAQGLRFQDFDLGTEAQDIFAGAVFFFKLNGELYPSFCIWWALVLYSCISAGVTHVGDYGRIDTHCCRIARKAGLEVG